VPSPESLIPEEIRLEQLSHDLELDPQTRLYYEHIAQVSPNRYSDILTETILGQERITHRGPLCYRKNDPRRLRRDVVDEG